MTIFWRILFPLVAPGLVATSIFSFITAYNEFIVALTFLGQAHATYTLPIYVTYFFGRGGAEWGPIMAASTMYTIPVMIFFLIVRRRLVGGLVAGGGEGVTRGARSRPGPGPAGRRDPDPAVSRAGPRRAGCWPRSATDWPG